MRFAGLSADLRAAQQEAQALQLQLQTESSRRNQLELMLAQARDEKERVVHVPAMLEVVKWVSQLSEEALEAARKGN